MQTLYVYANAAPTEHSAVFEPPKSSINASEQHKNVEKNRILKYKIVKCSMGTDNI